MAKSREPENVTLTYVATTAYKQWVRVQMKKRGWTQQTLVDEMRRRARAELLEIGKFDSLQTGTISMFLGPEDVPPVTTNSSLLPAINKTLGIAPPPICDPSDELAQLVERFRMRWNDATPRERATLIALLGNHDEGDVDGDRVGPGETSPRNRKR